MTHPGMATGVPDRERVVSGPADASRGSGGHPRARGPRWELTTSRVAGAAIRDCSVVGGAPARRIWVARQGNPSSPALPLEPARLPGRVAPSGGTDPPLAYSVDVGMGRPGSGGHPRGGSLSKEVGMQFLRSGLVVTSAALAFVLVVCALLVLSVPAFADGGRVCTQAEEQACQTQCTDQCNWGCYGYGGCVGTSPLCEAQGGGTACYCFDECRDDDPTSGGYCFDNLNCPWGMCCTAGTCQECWVPPVGDAGSLGPEGAACASAARPPVVPSRT